MPERACILHGLAQRGKARFEAGYGHLGLAPMIMSLLHYFSALPPVFVGFPWRPCRPAIGMPTSLAYAPQGA